MIDTRLRSLAKRATPYLLGALVLGGASFAADRYFYGDCCAAGSSCCHPGSPCCHGHKGAGPAVAQR
ncbi:MAG TPA: hypothetical protein VGI39_03680 [Polyangiaceae bacterium]|jgi:hypothetical protein